jgi:hypothetical protein
MRNGAAVSVAQHRTVTSSTKRGESTHGDASLRSANPAARMVILGVSLDGLYRRLVGHLPILLVLAATCWYFAEGVPSSRQISRRRLGAATANGLARRPVPNDAACRRSSADTFGLICVSNPMWVRILAEEEAAWARINATLRPNRDEDGLPVRGQYYSPEKDYPEHLADVGEHFRMRRGALCPSAVCECGPTGATVLTAINKTICNPCGCRR